MTGTRRWAGTSGPRPREMRALRALVAVLAVAAMVLAGGGLTAPAQAANLTATLSWEVLPRMQEPDGAVKNYHPVQLTGEDGPYTDYASSVAQSQLVPTTLAVRLTGAAAGAGTVNDCTFSSPQLSFSVTTGPTCSTVVNVPVGLSGKVNVSVDGSTGFGTGSETVTGRDLLVVGLGDSYGSGEGAGGTNPLLAKFTVYEDTRCDRTDLSTQARSAWALESADPHTSVTFLHLACSGAMISDPDPDDGGMLDGYVGTRPTDGADGKRRLRLLPQLEAVRTLLDKDLDSRLDRDIDTLMLSIGGNDMGFSDIVVECAFKSIFNDCYKKGQPGRAIFDAGIASLPGKYDLLRAGLESTLGLGWRVDDPTTALDEGSTLSPRAVYVGEYPVAADGADGQTCSAAESAIAGLPVMTQDEWQWAVDSLGPTLNTTLRDQALGYGWRFVSGASSRFSHHGICGDPSYYVFFPISLATQLNHFATMHPTVTGYAEMVKDWGPFLVANVLTPTPPPSTTFFPGAAGNANLTGTEGWTTGSCTWFDLADCEGHRNAYGWYTFEFHTYLTIPAPQWQRVGITVDGVAADVLDTWSCTAPALSACAITFAQGDDGTKHYTRAFVSVQLDAPGVHAISATLTNGAGQLIAAPPQTVKLDFTPPAVTRARTPSCQPAPGLPPASAGWCHGTWRTALNASDPGANPSGVLRLERSLVDLDTGAVTTPAFSPLPLPAASVVTTDGRYRLEWSATDHAGLSSPVASETLQLDTVPPVITTTGLASGPWATAGALSISVTDATSGVAPGSVRAFAGTGAAGSPEVVLTPTGPGTWSYTWPEGGAQQLHLVAADVSGLTSAVDVGPVSVDATPPLLAVTGGQAAGTSFTPSQLATGITTGAAALALAYTASDAGSGLVSVAAGGATSASPTGVLDIPLAPGAGTIAVVATDAVGRTSTTTVKVVRVTAPSAPLTVTAKPGKGSATVAWTAPATNGGAGITSYVVTGAPGGSCTTATTTCVIPGLTNGTPYRFTVRAVNFAGTGPASTSSAPIVPRTNPSAVRGLRATRLSPTSVRISWSPPLSTGGAAVRYQVRTTTRGGAVFRAWRTVTVPTSLLRPLARGALYRVQVRAVNPAGAGPAVTLRVKLP